MNFHLLHFGCSFRFGVGHRLSGRKPLPVNIPTERKRPDKRCFRFSEFCTWSEAIFLTLGLSELVSMLHRKMFFGWMTPKRVTGSIWSAHSSSRVTRRGCMAQRKHFFPPSSPMFESRLLQYFFSLLLSLWTVMRSNPSSAKQLISQMQWAKGLELITTKSRLTPITSKITRQLCHQYPDPVLCKKISVNLRYAGI